MSVKINSTNYLYYIFVSFFFFSSFLSFDHVIGEEYCNDTLKALRTSCSYILSCEPREACEAANVCSVIKEEMKDPISGVTLEPHGYANTTMAGIKVERCSECAKGYFRVGGRCELCPTDIMLLVALFICGIIGLCIGGYMLHVFKVNLAMASIGFDYMQVMSMFLKSDIRWPSAIRKLFRFMSAFNFDLDIASPECLVQEYYRFDIKWYSIMGMPLGMAFIFLIVHSMLWLKKKCIDQRTGKLNKHTHAMISMNLVMMYFLYLYVTKSALDVFNCVELDPPDAVHPEYTYMTAVGNVRCYQEGSLQMVLLPWAVLGILCYTLGYPIGLMILFWRNRVRIQRDQYLRACGKGDKREKNDLFNVYNIRKRYSALYYQFKPRCYYWAVVIIARKFSIASINLMLRQDVDYMLAASLLVMFVAFSVQLLNRPFMGPAEYQKVILNWNDRTSSVSALPLTINPLTVTTRGIKNDGGGGDTIISDGFSTLQKERSEQDKIGLRKRRPERSTMTLLRSGGRKGGTKCLQWLVNYNTVESVLLFCSVLIMLAGIMFSSSRFDNNKNLSELESITWITMIIIVISLMYYSIVFFLEIVAQTCPHRFCCDLSEHLGDHFVDRKKAKKRRRSQRLADNINVEMSTNIGNPLKKDGFDSTQQFVTKKKQLGKKGRKGRGRNGKEDKKLLVAGEENSDWLTHSDPKTGKDYFSNKNTGRVTWSDHSKNKLEEQNETKLSVGLVDGGNNEIETKKKRNGDNKRETVRMEASTDQGLLL